MSYKTGTRTHNFEIIYWDGKYDGSDSALRTAGLDIANYVEMNAFSHDRNDHFYPGDRVGFIAVPEVREITFNVVEVPSDDPAHDPRVLVVDDHKDGSPDRLHFLLDAINEGGGLTAMTRKQLEEWKANA